MPPPTTSSPTFAAETTSWRRIFDLHSARVAREASRNQAIRQGAVDQGQQVRLHRRAENGESGFQLERHYTRRRQDQLLLCPRRAGRWRNRLGFAAVDHL